MLTDQLIEDYLRPHMAEQGRAKLREHYGRIRSRMADLGYHDLSSDLAASNFLLIVRQMCDMRDPAWEHSMRDMIGVRPGGVWKL